MIWSLSHRCDPSARVIADRHYNRQSIGADNFVPPGRCLVLKTEGAFWVTSWPFAEFVRHAWPGAWVCSAFRKEGQGLASDMIRQAVAATRWRWSDVPSLGMITFVDRSKTKSKKDPGYCFLMAGFVPAGKTKGGLVALQLLPKDMPEAEAPKGTTIGLWDTSRTPALAALDVAESDEEEFEDEMETLRRAALDHRGQP